MPDAAPQGAGEHRPHLHALVRREQVDHAVDGLRRVQRVQRAQDQVTRLRRRGGHLGALGVPDLAYEETMSGSWRNTRLSARAYETAVSAPISRWLTMLFSSACCGK